MSDYKSVGRLIGEGLGTVIGEPIKYAGKKLNNTLITEIGDGVKKASAEAGETTGGLIGGTVQTAEGYLKNDDSLKKEGLKDLSDTAKRTVKGMEQALVQTWNHGDDVYSGFVKDDEERMLRGARGIAKAAAVAALTVGVFEAVDALDHVEDTVHAAEPEIGFNDAPTPINSYDVTDVEIETSDVQIQEQGNLDEGALGSDAEQIKTINADLEGSSHEETGVPYERDTVILPNGDVVSGVYPDFDEEFSVQVSESIYYSSDFVQFNEANEQLAYEIQHNDGLREQFTVEQLAQIRVGETPDGYVWHHHQEPGRLELVNEQTHAQTGHSGGRSLWGGGSENR
ncbi:HNH endonuclease [Neobacillus niacini]|uniref:HNH endonuclease n=1 Tax=Neobacillus niacini TaxID=86668 RepID=UPI002FFEF25F